MRKKSLKEIAYETLKENIFNGVFPFGAIYSGQYFADFLNMSRTPVREAILQLAEERFVTILPNRGIRIKSLNAKFLDELCQVRSMVDGYCASLLAEGSNNVNALLIIAELKDIIDRQDALLKEATVDDDATNSEWFDLDARFHAVIIEYVNNQYLTHCIMDIYHYIKSIGMTTATIKNRKYESTQENKKLLSVIISGDAALAYQYAVKHVEIIFSLMKDHISEE